MFSDPRREFGEAAEDVSVAGDQFRTTILKVGEGAEAVDLQFVDEVGRVERPERRESRMGRSLRDSIVRSIAK